MEPSMQPERCRTLAVPWSPLSNSVMLSSVWVAIFDCQLCRHLQLHRVDWRGPRPSRPFACTQLAKKFQQPGPLCAWALVPL